MFRFLQTIFGGNTKPSRRKTSTSKRFVPILEALEDRLVPSSIDLNAGQLQIEGNDDPDYGETVNVNVSTFGNSDPHDDRVDVSLVSQRGDRNQSFPMWKNAYGQWWTQNVTSIRFNGYNGHDIFFNNTALLASAHGGAGTDELYGIYGTGINNFFGEAGDDILEGGPKGDLLMGGSGHDTLYGYGGDDYLWGGNDDAPYGEPGQINDIDGGTGLNTVLRIGDTDFNLTDTKLTSGLGSDNLINIQAAYLGGGPSGNVLDASQFSGSVTLDGGAGYNYLYGGRGNDTLLGGANDDVLTGGPGNDHIYGGGGYNVLSEGGDVDFNLTNTSLTGLGMDTLSDIQKAILAGGDSVNRIDASQFSGTTILYGLGGDDVLIGGSNTDYLFGGNGNDTLYGMAGNDVLYGQNGHDTLHGGDNNDTLNGGDDGIIDDLWGDGGTDTFYRYGRRTVWGIQYDKIWDLASGETVYTTVPPIW